ncbi:MAG: hypothetical protein FWD04_12675 [Conexibacteraceae bacterium]|nr:hypothetical protein [Conexibacteraceae bacterium]
MRADKGSMTPISQHNYSVASVSYLGPAYGESPERKLDLRPVDSFGRRARTELAQTASPRRLVAVVDAR